MLKDEVVKYIKDWPDTITYVCSEATLRAANDYYNLGLNDDALKLAASFGGGMYSEDTCGVVIGGCMAIAKRYSADEPPHVNEKVKRTTKAWLEAVKNKYGSINCAELKEKCGGNCKLLVQEGCELFETVNG
jgi:C_GCAxxG_C_C family probable redox protein